MRNKTSKLTNWTVRRLRARRTQLVRQLPDVELTLRGSLQTQGRRCGKPSCHCATGDLHGPYVYLAVRSGEGMRLLYIPADLAGEVARRVEVTARLEGVLAEISAINIELLSRGELS
jgi:hypothetical protein